MNKVCWVLLVSVWLTGCTPAKEIDVNRSVDAVTASTRTSEAFLKKSAIYEINVRQFSEAGTLQAVTEQLPRLQALGVDILWLMPIQPISEVKRKGSLGSYYAIEDYTAVNPDYGTLADLRALVDTAHGLGQVVILDWVANHTGWDHVWIEQHPDWYSRNAAGEIIDPIHSETGEPWGWTDVADLNYDNRELWPAMVAAMQFWLDAVDVDGFRCDVAGEVPTEFWEFARPQLDRVKPVFMLAEAEKPELHTAFDMSYGWSFNELMNGIASGEHSAWEVNDYMQWRQQQFPADHRLMMFTTNHDENSWTGTVFERYGQAHRAFAVLAFTLDGMPLIYSGQEAGLNKRLQFFEKDPIDWQDYPLQPFYQQLLRLKAATPALWSGANGGEFVPLPDPNADAKSYVFERQHPQGDVLVGLNFSAEAVRLSIPAGWDQAQTLLGTAGVESQTMTLAPFAYVILQRTTPR
ncbi:alpha-amylase [Aestuariicella hydrocarbonica]|uniref:Alpha-amylase n=1 Tax=Pseudomaricurvus hydrocarbonicus TaxID=1470433 RepID=A0A9E5MNR1_9GAMM|nr:alpha-amylase family glycosyl hydrolase [Aestuariicella hydrocarbonica]NHO67641.1 alpha-amylase [Aestuariicella hydrocarbonica]